jgi:precorrin-2 dehydrogenase / sirohydrochlorin ferrochelatase
MMLYPIFLNLTAKRVVVIGGGTVAERKVQSLLEGGAKITVISPQLTAGLLELAEAGRLHLQHRKYRTGDCQGATLVLSATDDAQVSRAVWQEATEAGIMINTADQPAFCDFMMPAILRRGDLTVAISTAGSSPVLAGRLRDEISKVLGAEYEQLIELLASLRPEIRSRVAHEEDRKGLYHRILDSNVLALLRRNNREEAERLLRTIIEDFTYEGKTP